MKQRLFVCLTSGFDHFDTALYGFLAPILAPLFFQTQDPLVALILSYSVFATGIFFRPLGIFAAYATSKRFNVNVSLSLSLFLMGFAMFVMAVLPTIGAVGFWSPLGLVFARGVLDFSASWERNLSKLYLLDQTPPLKSVWWSSVYEGFSLGGMFLAALAAYGVQTSYVHWRTLFQMGAVAAFGCALLRMGWLRGRASYTFLKTVHPARLIWHNRGVIMKVALAEAFSYGTYSTAFILPSALLPLLGTLSWNASFYSLSYLYGIDFIAVIALGWWLRSVHPTLLLRLAASIIALTLVPLFTGLLTGGIVYSLCVRLWIVVWGALFAIALTPWERNLTPETGATRALILGAGKVLGTSLVGRNLVAISLVFYGLSDHLSAAALPLTLLGGMVFWCLTRKSKAQMTSKMLNF